MVETAKTTVKLLDSDRHVDYVSGTISQELFITFKVSLVMIISL